MRNEDNYSMSHSSLMHCTFFPQDICIEARPAYLLAESCSQKLMLFVLLAKHFINRWGLRQPSDNIVLLSQRNP